MATHDSNTIVLEDIEFQLDSERFIESMRIRPGTEECSRLQTMVDEARELARPRALFRPAYITARGDHRIRIDDIEFQSRVLAVNLEKVDRVFLFIATCGPELSAWAEKYGRYAASVLRRRTHGSRPPQFPPGTGSSNQMGLRSRTAFENESRIPE